MKKYANTLVLLALLVIGSSELFAGSTDYLANQSAEFIRTFNRNGSTEGADIVHYNPAATAYLDQGLYLNVSNQFMLKYYEIESSGTTYESNEPSLLVPNIYAIYNGGKWAGFAAFNITAGGGALVYEDGIVMTALLPDTEVEGSSMYFSGSLGGSYAINDMISVSLTGKYVYALKTFKIDSGVNGELDQEETASGFGGILGINIKPNEKLNIGLRIESEIGLEFETEIKKATGLAFSSYAALDGNKTDRDLPAVIGLGIQYQISEQLLTRVSFQGYMLGWANESDKDSYSEDYDDFGWEAGICFEYTVMPKFLTISAGYLYTVVGGNDDTYTETEYELDTHSIGIGAKLTAMEGLDINLGLAYSFYVEGENADGTEKYNKTVYIIALGVEKKI